MNWLGCWPRWILLVDDMLRWRLRRVAVHRLRWRILRVDLLLWGLVVLGRLGRMLRCILLRELGWQRRICGWHTAVWGSDTLLGTDTQAVDLLWKMKHRLSGIVCQRVVVILVAVIRLHLLSWADPHGRWSMR